MAGKVEKTAEQKSHEQGRGVEGERRGQQGGSDAHKDGDRLYHDSL